MDDLTEAVERLETTLDAIRKVLLGLLASVTTASVLLALNLAVGV